MIFFLLLGVLALSCGAIARLGHDDEAGASAFAFAAVVLFILILIGGPQ